MAVLSGLSGVILGAFGAHGLENAGIRAEMLHAWETAVEYQFYHTFALLFCGLAHGTLHAKWIKRAAWLFGLGILLFCGSLYGMAGAEAAGSSATWLGPITPLGGTLMVLGWGMLIPSLRN